MSGVAVKRQMVYGAGVKDNRQRGNVSRVFHYDPALACTRTLFGLCTSQDGRGDSCMFTGDPCGGAHHENQCRAQAQPIDSPAG